MSKTAVEGEPSSEKKFLSEEDRELLKNGMLKPFSPEDREAFLHFVERTHLDPFTKQIYATERTSKDHQGNKVKNLVIVTGVAGFLWIAERTNLYDGDDAPEWCGSDGVWKEVWTDEQLSPSACRVKTYRKDRSHASVAVVNWRAVVQEKDEYVNGKWTGHKILNPFWYKAGPGQLAKCALVASLRKLFPSQLAKIYIEDELEPLSAEELEKVESTNEAKAHAERARISEKLMEQEAKTTNGHVNRVKEIKPAPVVTPEDMEDSQPKQEPPADVPPADWWKTHKVELITNAQFKGKEVSQIDATAIQAAIEKWVPKVALRESVQMDLQKVLKDWKPTLDNAKQGKDFQLTAEAIVLRFLNDVKLKAQGALL